MAGDKVIFEIVGIAFAGTKTVLPLKTSWVSIGPSKMHPALSSSYCSCERLTHGKYDIEDFGQSEPSKVGTVRVAVSLFVITHEIMPCS